MRPIPASTNPAAQIAANKTPEEISEAIETLSAAGDGYRRALEIYLDAQEIQESRVR